MMARSHFNVLKMHTGGPGALPRRVCGGGWERGQLRRLKGLREPWRTHSLEGGEVDIYSQKGQSKGKPSRQHGQDQYLILVSSSFFSKRSLLQAGGEFLARRLPTGFL